ncbi:MAG: transposase [Deltaproteobacteria bacterium]|nr:transposase [Deltaproteobacteria bacterium]
MQQGLAFRDKSGRVATGRRPGRPRKAGAGAPHGVRPRLTRHCPVHVVLRVHHEVRGLRTRDMYRALREATFTAARRELNFAARGAFRIVHISIQHTHVHLLVEADDKVALSRGMQGFQISAAKHINRAYSRKAGLVRRRRGAVFPDRFHQEIITTPRQARNALAYVLNNWRKHREDRSSDPRWNVDPYSTGVLFDGWKPHAERALMWRWRDTYDPLVVYRPHTWLLREGWRRHGLLAFDEVPGATRRRATSRATPAE